MECGVTMVAILCHFNAVCAHWLLCGCGCRGNRTWQWWELMVVTLQRRRVPRLPYSFWPITRAPLFLRPGAAVTATGWPICSRTNIAVPFSSASPWFFSFILSFFLFLFFCCQEGFGACKWQNHVHISLSVPCICFTIQRKKTKKQLFSSITCSFLRAVWWDRKSVV